MQPAFSFIPQQSALDFNAIPAPVVAPMPADPIREALARAVGGEARFASSFTNRTMRDLNARAARELDGAAEACRDMLAKVAAALSAEGLGEYRQGDDAALVARYVRFWAAYQHAGSRVANWFVTGPANFPVAANNKRMATEDRRFTEYLEFVKQAPAREVKRAKAARARSIGAAGLAGAELADLQARLARREHRQAMMRKVNALLRKHKGDAQAVADASTAAGFPLNAATAAELAKPDCCGRIGFADFQLSNNNAEIHRLRARVANVAAKVARMDSAADDAAPVTLAPGLDCLENVADDRLQLFFDGKPSDAVRSALKSRGFRWSPRAGAWQRQLTNAARFAAQCVKTQYCESQGIAANC